MTHASDQDESRSRAPEALRIGYVSDDLYPGFGGTASATHGHIEALVGLGHEVRVLAGSEPHPEEPPAHVTVRRLPAWQPGAIQTKLALPLPSAIGRLVGWADVIHVNTPTPLALAVGAACRWHGVPCVMGVHTQLESSSLHFERGRRIVEYLMATWFRTLYRLADALTAPTPFAADLVGAFTDRPVHVVSNGVRIPDHVPSRSEARAALAPELLDDLDAPVLMYLGRLAPEKRPRDLLDLLERLPDDVVLWIAGLGPLEAELAREAKARGLQTRAKLLGFVSEAQKTTLLAAADLFVMPSPTELQSIATLEAMAHRCAVAAANYASSAVPSVVEEAGAGIVYDPADPEAAAGRIADLLADRATLRAYQGSARGGAERHSLRRSGERLEEIYQQLVGLGNAPRRRLG